MVAYWFKCMGTLASISTIFSQRKTTFVFLYCFPVCAYKMGSTLKGKNLLLVKQIPSFRVDPH